MKKNPFLASFVIFLVIIPFLSCKTAPAAPPPDEPQPQAGAEQPSAPAPAAETGGASLKDLDDARARADAARKKAGDFDGPSYFPSDWGAAEAEYTGAGLLPKASDDDIAKAAAAYNSCADSYDAIFKLAIPLYAQAREDEITVARNNAIAAGLKDDYPEYFSPADDTAIQAMDQYESEDYYQARDTAAKALMMYETMTTGYQAWQTQEEITLRGFADYDPDNFERAGEIINGAVDSYAAGDISSAKDSANDALERYELVLSTGWAAYAEERASSAEAERQAALDIKADIAAKDLFREADGVYKPALSLYNDKNYEEAVKLFINAETIFIMASETASLKRRYAADAIKEANDRVTESGETAKRAELVIEGGAR